MCAGRIQWFFGELLEGYRDITTLFSYTKALAWNVKLNITISIYSRKLSVKLASRSISSPWHIIMDILEVCRDKQSINSIANFTEKAPI
jgi:hypothetical protein